MARELINLSTHTLYSGLYDFKDSKGEWFSALLSRETGGERVHIHYVGFPGLDEEVEVSNCTGRVATIQGEDWRARLKIDDKVDVFIQQLSRFVSLKVLEIRKDSTETLVKVGKSTSSAWLSLSSDSICKEKSRTTKTNHTPFPNGVETVLALIESTTASAELKTRYALELASNKQLPPESCMKMFSSFEEDATHTPRSTVETRRLSDARAATMLELAFDPSNSRPVDFGVLLRSTHDDLVNAKVGGVEFSNLCVGSCGSGGEGVEEGYDDDETSDDEEENEDECFFDATLLGVNAMLRHAPFFKVSLQEEWPSLPPKMKFLLELADELERRAWKSNGVVKRRTLFAESAFLIRKAMLGTRDRQVLQECNGR